MISNPQIDKYGTKYWFNEQGKLHRDGDLPAVEYIDGSKEWWEHGKRHRDGDFPAIEYTNGSKAWYKNGRLHREQDKPAIEWVNRSKEWWKHGKMLSSREIEALQRKWAAVRNGNTYLLTEELLNEL